MTRLSGKKVELEAALSAAISGAVALKGSAVAASQAQGEREAMSAQLAAAAAEAAAAKQRCAELEAALEEQRGMAEEAAAEKVQVRGTICIGWPSCPPRWH